ncbi:uncharacterized protein [Parasteatoda tepidariorum]|uniref:uncharacterized protein n=1 Tax=Parasteatoda tepidariorum TaxID=114398 RepID=UPI00077F9266|nr:cuticle protein 21 [Parasteatoda tepidariorum]
MAKFATLAFALAFVAVASAASFGGVKDLVGNYYDFTTGQYSSALTGKVYNTAPVAYVPPVAAAPVAYAPPVVAPYAAPYAPYVAAAAAPYIYSAPFPYSAAYIPAWKK